MANSTLDELEDLGDVSVVGSGGGLKICRVSRQAATCLLTFAGLTLCGRPYKSLAVSSAINRLC